MADQPDTADFVMIGIGRAHARFVPDRIERDLNAAMSAMTRENRVRIIPIAECERWERAYFGPQAVTTETAE